jgi:hypothetical protein
MKNEEHKIQAAAIKELSYHSAFQWLFAIPNGGARDPITGARMRREGVRSGVWDLFFPHPCYSDALERAHELPFSRSGLWIEVKSATGRIRRLTEKQAEFGIYVYQQGFAIAICRSSREIVDVCRRYLGNVYWESDQALQECQERLESIAFSNIRKNKKVKPKDVNKTLQESETKQDE